MKNGLQQLKDELEREYVTEVQNLKDIGGPTGMRNSISSALGLARNTVRLDIMGRLQVMIETGDDANEKT